MFEESFVALVDGQLSDEQGLAFLRSLKEVPISAEMLTFAARTMRERMTCLESPLPLLDPCGTGGDQQATVNISTASAFVLAAVGVPIAKHGNRAVSSSSGSYDVLQVLGVEMDQPVELVQRCLEETNLGLCFAPRFHPRLRALAPLRKQLGFPTVFNYLGPLCNPAKVRYQVLGVGKLAMLRPMAEALRNLGVERAVVVHGMVNPLQLTLGKGESKRLPLTPSPSPARGEGRQRPINKGETGLDEVSLAGMTHAQFIDGNVITELHWEPEEFGLPRASVESIRCRDAAESASHLLKLFHNEDVPVRQWVLANAAVGLWIAGQVNSVNDGVQRAAEVLGSGGAMRVLESLRAMSAVR